MPQESTTSPKKEEVIEIASRLFYEQGFGATGIKQIIEAANIAKGTFYTHFRSKEELGLAWLRGRHAEWGRWFEEAVGSAPTSGEKILASFEFLGKWLENADYRGCAFLNTMAEIPDPSAAMREEAINHKTELHMRFQTLALEHFKSKKLGENEARQKGTALYLLFEGALVEAQNFCAPWPITAAHNVAKTMLQISTST